MKKRIIIAAFVVAAFVAITDWLLSAPSIAVRNVREAETLVLGQDAGNPCTYGISIHGSGHIDGEATLSLMVGGKPYRVQKLRGDINFEWDGDWYAETAEVRYEPAGVRSGKVVLSYQFHKL